MDAPLVTIIVTTYNYAHTVGTAIDSALAQDYPNVEILVVDNASTDGTSELMERYRAERRLRYLRNAENIGMVPNHNKGLREARGEYVLFLSADDFLMPHHVSRSYAHLQAHPEIDVLYTSTYFVDEHGSFIGVRQMAGQPLGAYNGGRRELPQLFTEGCYMCFPTMLMKRELYERFGELDEEIKAADYEIVMRWAANGVRFGYLPEQSCAVRLHSAQQSSAQNYVAVGGDIAEFIYLARKFCDRYGDQIDGFEETISRMMWNRYGAARNSGAPDEGGALREQMLDVDRMLSAVKARNAQLGRRKLPTVIVLPGASAGEASATFASLLAQTRTDWEAVALDYAWAPFAAIGEHLDPRGRIRPFRLFLQTHESVAVNTAIRVAAGDWFVVVHAGTVLPAQHLEHLTTAFEQSGAQLVRTIAALDGRSGVFPAPSDGTSAFVAPFGPVEALAFTRGAVDHVGAFDERLGAFAEWEFYLRASNGVPAVSLNAPVSVAAATVGHPQRIAALPALARRMHEAFAVPALAEQRAAYLRRIEQALAGATAPGSDVAARLTEAAYGIPVVAGVS